MKHLPHAGQHGIRWLAVLAIGAAAMLAGPTTPASAHQGYPTVGSVILIQSNYSGRCLDADLNSIARNGTVVQLWDCNAQSQQL
jgi:hypothetical protein